MKKTRGCRRRKLITRSFYIQLAQCDFCGLDVNCNLEHLVMSHPMGMTQVKHICEDCLHSLKKAVKKKQI